MVAAGLASRCQVSLAYAIGVAQPVMVQVDTFGTGKVCADDCLEMAIPLVFGLTPKQIVDTLRLPVLFSDRQQPLDILEERNCHGSAPIR